MGLLVSPDSSEPGAHRRREGGSVPVGLLALGLPGQPLGDPLLRECERRGLVPYRQLTELLVGDQRQAQLVHLTVAEAPAGTRGLDVTFRRQCGEVVLQLVVWSSFDLLADGFAVFGVL